MLGDTHGVFEQVYLVLNRTLDRLVVGATLCQTQVNHGPTRLVEADLALKYTCI
ncbi:hypothetical protein DPMN_162646 [Dreissena polymorpha]|uniref:Uncharacterized protein n=1 Tax=Dreissena polymorpha TaxID=45954 RepID=A0A9D4EVG9_DREPO|nr:hypothetical protein DPMN_162646 [Dreissena polymorpha]